MPRTWREKLLDDKDLPKVMRMTGKLRARFGSGTMLIPAPREVDAIMRKVPPGKLITVNEIRQALARRHGATITCPMTTGIFAWIAAHAAAEADDMGLPDITPFWRTLKAGGELNAKYPGGIQSVQRRLEAEGHRVVLQGRKRVVQDFQASLFQPRVRPRSA